CTVHILHDYCDVLKPAIITVRVGRKRTALRVEIFGEFERLVAQPEPSHAHSNSEHTFQMVICIAGDLKVCDLFEVQDFRIELHGMLETESGDPYSVDPECSAKSGRRYDYNQEARPPQTISSSQSGDRLPAARWP